MDSFRLMRQREVRQQFCRLFTASKSTAMGLNLCKAYVYTLNFTHQQCVFLDRMVAAVKRRKFKSSDTCHSPAAYQSFHFFHDCLTAHYFFSIGLFDSCLTAPAQ